MNMTTEKMQEGWAEELRMSVGWESVVALTFSMGAANAKRTEAVVGMWSQLLQP